jgi:MFS family permease
MKFKNLNPIEKQTARLLLWSAAFNGIIMSMGQTQDIIARKALNAAAWQLTVMAMIWPISNFMSIWWGRMFEKSCHKSRYFIFVGVFGRLSLIYGLWLTGMNEFMLMLGLMFSFNSLLIPAQNTIYQKNIDASRRGKVYGYTMSVGMLMAVGFTLFAGRILDINEEYFRLILVVTAVGGFISAMLLSLIKIQDSPAATDCQPMNWKQTMLDPLKRSVTLLKVNKPFALFERDFSIYGMGFIMVQPVLPFFLVDTLKLSYTGNFLAKGIISQIPMLLLSPYLGKWHDKLHPFRFISIFFGLLALFPAMLLLSSLVLPYHTLAVALVYLGFFIFGIAMTGVNIAWNMSSIYFAGKDDASMYQSVHVTMTGIRGILAPLLGLFLMKTFGITSVFIVACGFLVTASIISYKDFQKTHI